MWYFIIGIIAIAVWIYSNQKPKPEPMEKTDYTPQEIELNASQWQFFKLLKQHRASLGLPDVSPEKKCTQLAIRRINDLTHLSAVAFKNNGHKGLEDYKKELEKNNFIEVGEILAGHWNSVPAMFRNYIESEDHRDYIESPKVKYVGVGVVDFDFKFYSCIIFTENHNHGK